jgi:microcin C transport system substrate-binding protein
MQLLPRLTALACALFALSATAEPRHGAARFHDLKYGPDWTHYEHVVPDASKGGQVTLSAVGTFDSLNPWIIRGDPGPVGLIYQTLMTESLDEPFSMYGVIAETIDIADDWSSVSFQLRPEARWHDGAPITVDDVIWTFNTLREQGTPFYRYYWNDVERVEQTGDRRVTFVFTEAGRRNPELPLILGQMPVLAEHDFAGVDFGAPSLRVPLGSGAYRVADVDAGRSVTFERVKDWWAADLPVNKGRYNFDRLRYDYYLDRNIDFEAFKAGRYDYRPEFTSRIWATSYDFPALNAGLVTKEAIPHERPQGMQGFVMNTRRDKFQDPRVRQALNYAFDFDWVNANIMYGLYKRTDSYFDNSDMAAEGEPGELELKYLEPFRDQLSPEVFGSAPVPPNTGGTQEGLRANLQQAFRLLQEAGYEVRGGKMVNAATGQPLRFELLLQGGAAFEPHANAYRRNLERLGIEMNIRAVDDAQYRNRTDNFDFDMVVGSWGQSESPGNEQRDFWGSDAADRPGSRNLIGVKDPVVDALIEEIVTAESREELDATTQALDRVLRAGHYVVPHWHKAEDWVAYWNKFERPATQPRNGVDLFSWWIDPGKAARVASRQGDVQTE